MERTAPPTHLDLRWVRLARARACGTATERPAMTGSSRANCEEKLGSEYREPGQRNRWSNILIHSRLIEDWIAGMEMKSCGRGQESDETARDHIQALPKALRHGRVQRRALTGMIGIFRAWVGMVA